MEIADGLSTTFAITEDAGRQEEIQGISMTTAYSYGDGEPRKFWRWAEPDNAFGVSRPINNHSQPFGGPEDCPWTSNNCGPNDEMFGFHPGGVNALFCDGHVAFMSDSLNPILLRRLVTRDGGETTEAFD